jgi:malonyl-CoA O-methyltransferase
MPSADSPSKTRRDIDDAALERLARRMAAAPQAPWLHAEVARRMGERLELIKRTPAEIVDWWARAGAGAAVLQTAYPAARRVEVEQRPTVTPPRARWWPAALTPTARVRAVTAAELGDGAAQLVWANMALHLLADPMPTLRAWQRALAVDGFLMFSTLGPGSLPQLRALYEANDWGPPLAALTDMHDIGDMLVEAGFAGPVMDQELLTLTWPDARAALLELRSLGANLHPRRCAGLRTPRWQRRLEAGLQRMTGARKDRGDGRGDEVGNRGRIELTLEIVYGHAFKPLPRARLLPESTLPLADMRTMVRARPGGG